MPQITVEERIRKLGICKMSGRDGLLIGPTARKEWFTAAELAVLSLPGLPCTKAAMHEFAVRNGWWRHLIHSRCATLEKDVEYHISLLPEVAQTALRTMQSVVSA